MTESRQFDLLDRQLVCALQRDGRASWGTIAQVLGVSERTVARRAGDLLGSGKVRVVAVRNAFLVPGWSPMTLRVRCRTGQVGGVAEALARRRDVLWTDIVGSGDEVCATVFSRSPEQRNALLLRDLPATPAVTSWTAYGLVKVFAEALRWNAGLLDPEQQARLGPARGPVSGVRRPTYRGLLPDPVDERLAEALVPDARRSFADLAERAGVSESTARRRVSGMLADGSLRVTVDVDPALLGFEVEVALWLAVRPDLLERTGRKLARHPATWFVGATTGPANLVVYLALPTQDELYGFLGGLPEVTQCETTVFLRTVKRAGVTRR